MSDTEKIREQWLARLGELIDRVEGWAVDLDWSTRRIEKSLEDYEIGDHIVPALLMQKEAVKVLLEPIGRNAPGAEAVVDLYVMPAYDDIASLYYYDGCWNIHFVASREPVVAGVLEAGTQPLSKDAFSSVLDEMTKNAA